MDTQKNFSELVKIRQSTRKYQDKPVEKEKIIQCIEAARLAPSATNSQPWKFIVVDDEELKTQIAETAASLGMNKFTYNVPIIIAVVLEKPNLVSSVSSVIKDKEFFLIDIGIVANQLCLQATDLGLGTCIVGWFDEKKIKKILKIENKCRVPLLITVGYSDSPIREKKRKSLDTICNWNKY